jgi:polyribonucleotide nucleotidyltransferase
VKVTVEREIGGRKLSLTTGELAKQASGAVLVQYGETVVFVAAQRGPGREGADFFPLTVDYRERTAAAGKFPGGFIKREGRPTLKEVLTSRLTDRPIRPLFPEGYLDEVQVMANVLACDGENDPDILAIIGASAALSVAGDIPFMGPLSAVRVGMINEQFLLMPKQKELATSALDLVVAGTKSSILMIEGFGDQLPEDQMADALMFGHRAIQQICELQQELVQRIGLPAKVIPAAPVNPLAELLRREAYNEFRAAKSTRGKQERADAVAAVIQRWKDKLFPAGAEVSTEGGATAAQFSAAIHDLEYRIVRDLALEGMRPDGRGTGDLRSVSCSVGVLPRVHGSALFTRGETQSLVTITLGTVRDEQRVDGLFEEYTKRFMLDYYFPSYSVGECRPIRGPGRREMGHGALAERSVERVLPAADKFPYTIRVISDITESNGSSSMASVCGATLGLMDAGVQIKQPVAGISIGLVKDGDRHVLLTDIIGDEDHFGDMDFKIAGTGKGITGIQLDLKIAGIDEQIIRGTLAQARTARLDADGHWPAAQRDFGPCPAAGAHQDRPGQDWPVDWPRRQDDSVDSRRNQIDGRRR